MLCEHCPFLQKSNHPTLADSKKRMDDHIFWKSSAFINDMSAAKYEGLISKKAARRCSCVCFL